MPEITQTEKKARELVVLIYSLEAEVKLKAALLKATKQSLILLEAPAKIAAKVRAGEELSEADLVELRAAVAKKYLTEDGRWALVVVPELGAKSYDLYPKDGYKAWLTSKGKKKGSVKLEREWRGEQEAKARNIAGNNFAALFDHLPSYRPATGFAEFAPRLLTAAKGRDLVTLCEVQAKAGAPHVKIDKPDEDAE